MLVADNVAVITGGASGIGEATAKKFGEHGANVVIGDIDESGGTETVADVLDAGGEATFVRTDVSREGDVRQLIETAVEEYGGLDVLFNNAGTEGALADFAEYESDDFDHVVDVNLRGTFYGMKYGIQAMLADGGGSIVSTSSVASATGIMGRAGYSASKAGINAMTRAAAMEYAEDGIRVNAILPGIVATSMQDRVAVQRPDTTDRYEISEAMPGRADPEELANAVLFLGSDLSSRITGVSLPVEGGFLLQP
ncbi:SDR family NAD(P)-dependent oxidoreductase [Halobellus captivus]|uniref:SDR family NAD(P)-dependent oxidoreductase n=1 Tax=Halobellus captivus TaxID=2592614 RepID=UPI0011AB1FDA|nr:SDR family NAD(P)-dependent oxidoreductase [Halobellus captivus]